MGNANVVMPASGKWGRLAASHGPDCIRPLHDAATEVSYGAAMVGAALVDLLSWLSPKISMSPEGREARFLHVLLSAHSDRATKEADQTLEVRLLVDILNVWKADYVVGDARARTTQTAKFRGLVAALQVMGERHPSRFPCLDRDWFKTTSHHVESRIASLGMAGWTELDGLPDAARERQALLLVREAFFKEFEANAAAFEFGRALIGNEDGAPAGADSVARERLRCVLNARKEVLAETNCAGARGGRISKSDRWTPTDPETWKAAGLPQFLVDLVPEPGPARNRFVSLLVLGCMGPTLKGTVAAMGVVLCDTGWNLQPMLDLPLNPFAFCGMGTRHVATAAIIQSFKSRAGHHVLGYLGSDRVASGRHLEDLTSTWRNSVTDIDPNGLGDGHAVLKEGGAHGASALSVMDRYSTMASAIRQHCSGADKEIYWIGLRYGGQPQSIVGTSFRFNDYFPDAPVLSRKEVFSQAIRKTVLCLRRVEAGSIVAVRPAAGHGSTRLLMPHYLNSPSIKAELDRSIRDFQNGLEVLALRDLNQNDVSIRLSRSTDDLLRVRDWALRAGLAQTLGISLPEVDVPAQSAREPLAFSPSTARLRELYLLHRALQQARSSHQHIARWRIRWLPVLALTKAIGREVFKAGLGRRYRQAAKQALQEIKQGSVSMTLLDA